MNKLLKLLCFSLIVFHVSAQDDLYYYGCENCYLTSLVPFGEYKIGVYLNPSDASKSSLILLNKNNIGLDTLSGYLSGFLGIVKTGQRSFVSYGYGDSANFIISENRIKINRAIGVRYSRSFEFKKMQLSHPTISIDAFLIGIFHSHSKNYSGLDRMAIGYIDINNSPTYSDNLTQSQMYYGGRIPPQEIYLVSGKSKETKYTIILENNYSSTVKRNIRNNYTYLDGVYYCLAGFNNEIFKIQNKNSQAPTANLLKIDADPLKYKIIKILADQYKNNLIAIVRNLNTNDLEGWKININNGVYSREFKTMYIPYFIEDGQMFIFINDDKFKNILKLPI